MSRSHEEQAHDEQTLSSRAFRGWLLALAGVGLAVRLAFVLGVQSRITELPGDAGWYHFQAKLVAEGKGFLNPVFYYDSGAHVPGADHPPGFVLLLAFLDLIGISTPQGQRIVMCLIGTVSVVVIGLLGRRLASPRVGLIAAAIAAVYPNIWVNDGMLLTETVFILATAVSLLFVYRYYESRSLGDLAAISAALSVAMMVRPESAALFVILVLPLVLTRTALRWRQRLVQLGVAALIPLVVLAPWVTYNLNRFEAPVLLSSGLGQTLRAGNCDAVYSGELIGFWDFSCLADPVDVPAGGTADLSPMDAEYQREAFRYMADNADRLPAVMTARIARVWGVFRPSQTIYLDGVIESRAGGAPGGSLAIAREAQWSYWVLLPLAAAGTVLLRRRRVQVLPLFAQAALITVVAAFTFGLTRYRAGVEVSIVVLAAVALSWIWSQLTEVPEAAVHGPLGASHTAGSAGAASAVQTSASDRPSHTIDQESPA